ARARVTSSEEAITIKTIEIVSMFAEVTAPPAVCRTGHPERRQSRSRRGATNVPGPRQAIAMRKNLCCTLLMSLSGCLDLTADGKVFACPIGSDCGVDMMMVPAPTADAGTPDPQ